MQYGRLGDGGHTYCVPMETLNICFIWIFIHFSDNDTNVCPSAAEQAFVACTLAEWAKGLCCDPF